MDHLIKLRILHEMLSYTFSHWLSDVAKKDLSENYCCDGRGCGCEGATIEQIYTQQKYIDHKEDR